MTDPFAPGRPVRQRGPSQLPGGAPRPGAPIQPVGPAPTRSAPDRNQSRNQSRSRSVWGEERRLAGFALSTLVVGLLAGVGAALSGAEPTTLPTWNLLLTLLVFAGVTVLGTYAPRWAVLAFACLTTAFGGVGEWTLCGLVAITISLAAILLDRRDRFVSAVAVGLTVQLLVRLPENFFFGFETLLATGLSLLIAWTGFTNLERLARRRARQTLLVAGFATGFALFVAAIVVIDARGPAQAGVSTAQAGLAAARNGEVANTATNLEDARQAFSVASETLGAQWAWPARMVPVVSQHLELLTVATQEGSSITEAASIAVDRADLSELSLANGSVDITTLRDLSPRLEQLAADMSTAQVELNAARSQWIVAPLDRRVDGFAAELDRAVPEADLAAHASRVVPGLLGADGNRNYLLLFGSPSESRELGGFVGSWAMVAAEGGAITKVASGRSIDLYDRARAGTLDHPDGYPALFLDANPGRWPQNLTSTPHVEEVARAAADLFPELEGRAIDGVVYLDPFVVEGLLQLIGPLRVEGSDVELTGDNAASFLITDQYGAFADDPLASERHQFLADTFDATFEALTTSALPGPERLGEVLGPLAREGRLQFATFDDEANEFLERIFLLQRLGDPAETDVLSIVHVNGTANKLDAFVSRDVEYRAVFDPSSRDLSGEVIVDLHLDVPDDAPAYVFGVEGRNGDYAPEEHRVLLSIYTPHDLIWTGVDGEPTIAKTADEFGLKRHVVPVLLHAEDRTTATVRFVLEGELPPGSGYVLDVANQPLVNRDLLRVEVTNLATGESTVAQAELDQDLRLAWGGSEEQ